jgi:universal stress protein A
MSFRKLLCAVDFSEASRAALREALELAARFDAEITLVHVHEAPVTFGFPDAPGGSFLPSARAREEQTLAEWKNEAWRRGERPVHTLHPEGVAWDRIVELARDFDLVVLGSQGRTGLARALVGSVAEKVVRHAPCPVLVVRAKA